MASNSKPPKMKAEQERIYTTDNTAAVIKTTKLATLATTTTTPAAKNGKQSTKKATQNENKNKTNNGQQVKNKNSNKQQHQQQQKTQNNKARNGLSQQQQKTQNSGNKSKPILQQQNSNNLNSNSSSDQQFSKTQLTGISSSSSYAQTVGKNQKNNAANKKPTTTTNKNALLIKNNIANEIEALNIESTTSAGDMLTAALSKQCAKCLKPTADSNVNNTMSSSSSSSTASELCPYGDTPTTTTYICLESFMPQKFTQRNQKQYRKSKSYVGSSNSSNSSQKSNGSNAAAAAGNRTNYQRSYSERRNSFDRHFVERNKQFAPIEAPAKPILASSNIAAVIADFDRLVIFERVGKGRTTYPIMQVSVKLSFFILILLYCLNSWIEFLELA